MSAFLCLPIRKFYKKVCPFLLIPMIALFLASCENGDGSHLGDGHDFGENNPDIYVALGNSITAGYGLTNYYESYPVRLSEMLQKTVVNAGIGGHKSSDGYARTGNILQVYKPGYLLILLGANDLIHGWSETYTIANLRGIIHSARNNKTIPVIATLTPAFERYGFMSGRVVSLNERIRELAKDENVPLVDLEREFYNNPLLFMDGLHPNAEGQAIIAAAFNDVLRSRSVHNRGLYPFNQPNNTPDFSCARLF